jgi:hypothetical protein
MSISPSARYLSSNDCIMGLDFTKNEMANQLFVFMLRGIYRNWKQPIGYFLVSHSVQESQLKGWIYECIHLSHEAGINVSYVQ